MATLKEATFSSADNSVLDEFDQAPLSDRISVIDLVRRPTVDLELALKISEACGRPISIPMDPKVWEQFELAAAYDSYSERETRMVDQTKRLEDLRIPDAFGFLNLVGLSYESREKLGRGRPTTVGQASRVPGVRPSDVAFL